MDAIIRRATIDDVPLVLDLIREFAAFQGKSDQLKATLVDFEKNGKLYDCLLVETEDKAIGYAFYIYTFHTWTGKSIYIDDLFVKEEFRRQGIGNKLVDELYKIALKNDCNDIRWQVSNQNEEAMAFYESIGAVVGDDNLNCKLNID